MADEAFALSPISARATLPSEADYDAISEAFMETSRGRWFLSEYAKRNRNADTRMVLDAVARIEQNLAARNDAAADNGLAEALAAISSAIVDAKSAASDALDGRAIEESLGPIRNGALIIRETLLRLREIGADGRIYDLMDSQVSAIEAGCGQLAAGDLRTSLNAAFEMIEQRIRQFARDSAQPPSPDAHPSAATTADEETSAAGVETASPSEAAPEPAMEVTAPETVAASAQTDIETTDTETALDDALDMIALEMAALDVAEEDASEFCMAEPEPDEPGIVAQVTESVTVPKSEPMPAPPSQPSLGASLIANGIVRNPNPSGLDPLAPIRRMSQAEKIAFFS